MIEDRIERWGEALERKDPGNVGSLQTGAALATASALDVLTRRRRLTRATAPLLEKWTLLGH